MNSSAEETRIPEMTAPAGDQVWSRLKDETADSGHGPPYETRRSEPTLLGGDGLFGVEVGEAAGLAVLPAAAVPGVAGD